MNHELAETIGFWAIVIGTSIVVLSFIVAAILMFCKRHTIKNEDNKK